MIRRRNNFLFAILGILTGMGGELHFYAPGFGTIAMLDFVSYFIAIPIIITQWKKMGKFMRRSLLWAFAWTFAAMLANFFNYVEFRYWVKCVAIASSSWAIMAAGYMLLRNHPTAFLWYLVGTGIGGWIALYHFRSGSLEAFATRGDFGGEGYGVEYLIDKQIYPSVARGLILGGWLSLCIWFKKIPVFLSLAAMVFAGFYLLINGGSRSSFGMFCGAAAVGFFTAYGSAIFQRIGKNLFFLLVLAGCCLFIVFIGYKNMATSGRMGEGEDIKYENQFGGGGRDAINGRAGFDLAFQNATDSYMIGLGWHQRNHSAIANALACEGVLGFLFWVYFYLQCLWITGRRMPYAKKYAAFIMLAILSAGWDVLGSPFGTRHKFFILMAFIALCRDNAFYGVGKLFDEKILDGEVWGRGLRGA